MAFTEINGSVKVPLRWVRDERDLNEYRQECEHDDVLPQWKYALDSPKDRLPPFQFWFPSGAGVITDWKLYDAETMVEVMSLFPNASQLDVEPFVDESYVLYRGNLALDTPLPTGVFRMKMWVDGEIHYSERIRTLCDGGYGEELLVNGDFADDLNGIDIGGDGIYAVDSKPTPGAPVSPGTNVGDIIIGFGDNLIYTWNGASWDDSLPQTGRAYLDGSTGSWYRFQPPFGWQGLANAAVDTSGGSACWSGEYDLSLLFPTDLDAGQQYKLIVQFGSVATVGTLHITGPGGVDVSTTGSSSVEVDFTAGSGPISLASEGGYDGCVSLVSLKQLVTAEDCYGRLEWRHCKALGTVWYTTSYRNKFFINRQFAELSTEINTVIEGNEDNKKNFSPDFRRKDVIYTLNLGHLPWFVVDALTEVPLCDTIEYFRPGRSLPDVLRRVVVRAESDDVGESCEQLVTISFQLDEATVSTACCTDFSRPCITPCQTNVLGFTDEYDGPGWYILPNLPQYAFNDGDTLSAPVSCPSRLVTTAETFGAHRYLYFTGGEAGWVPLASIEEMSAPGCNGEPTDLVIYIQGGYSGQLEVSYDGGATWVRWGNVFTDTQGSFGLSILLPEAGDIRVKVVTGDCVIGYSEATSFDCCTGAVLKECTFYQDFREAGSDYQTTYVVTNFKVNGDEKLVNPVPFVPPLNVISVGGLPFVTNLIDALNKCDVCGFSFWPYPNKRTEQDGFYGGYFRLRWPSTQTFEIIIKDSFGNFCYRYTDSLGVEQWDGMAWVQSAWPYEAETPGWTPSHEPEDCVTLP